MYRISELYNSFNTEFKYLLRSHKTEFKMRKHKAGFLYDISINSKHSPTFHFRVSVVAHVLSSVDHQIPLYPLHLWL